jgi:hypothetical protein
VPRDRLEKERDHGGKESARKEAQQDVSSRASSPRAPAAVDIEQRLSKFSDRVQDKFVSERAEIMSCLSRALESDMERRLEMFMRMIEDKLNTERAELIDTFVNLCASVEERSLAKLENLQSEITKTRSEVCHDQDKALVDVSPYAASDMTVRLEMAAQIQNTESEIQRLRDDLLEGGLLLPGTADVLVDERGSSSTERLSPMIRTVSEAVLKQVKADDDLRQMQQEQEVLRQSLQDITTWASAQSDKGDAVKCGCDQGIHNLQDTINEVVTVVGLELQQQRQQRIDDARSFTLRLDSLEHSLTELGNRIEKPRFGSPLWTGNVKAGTQTAEHPSGELNQLGSSPPAAALAQLLQKKVNDPIDDPMG